MHLIEPYKYTSTAVFDNEAKNIFCTQWLYACLITDVEKFRDYFVVEIMGRSVIIFNNGKTIKAFQNVCPHRFNRIFTDKQGNSPLVCRYHLWGFNEDGKLIGKDKKAVFPNPTELDICLKQYKLEIVGKFIFIHFSETPNNLDEQLGNLKEELVTISDIMNEEIHQHTIPHSVNWKFIVENVVELNHCKAIHKETLVRSGYCLLEPKRVKVALNSYSIAPPIEDEARQKRDKIFSKYLPRPITDNTFKHILLFPNFTISIFEGLIITIGQILPRTPNSTDYNLRYFFTKLTAENAVGTNLLEDMKISMPEYSTKLFAEDKAMLEQLQKGVSEVEHSGFIYETEERLIWFFESYYNLMN